MQLRAQQVAKNSVQFWVNTVDIKENPIQSPEGW